MVEKEQAGFQWIHKALLLVAADVLIILFSYFFALLLRFDFIYTSIPQGYIEGYLWSMPYWVISTVVVFYICRLYHSIWRLASVAELQMMVTAYFSLLIVYVAGAVFMGLHMPRSYFCMGYIISFCLTTIERYSYRLLRYYVNHHTAPEKEMERVMIIGGGTAGQILIKEMLTSDKVNAPVQICCIIDDNPSKLGRVLEGVPIVGNRHDIVAMAQKYRIDRIIYAIPATTGKNRKDILNICKETKCRLQTVPGAVSYTHLTLPTILRV